ncbi:unnamed protein product [Microthlaspi erraticum]|uniref:Uncharacterized protein n=1 Tax=Microthlaspi erraticum TaxID=1685480 RepID=A0A6D2ISK1_9BRAS|nr:unnamed protein product [Microthlaspi erraticum]
MDSQDHNNNNTQQSSGGKSNGAHVCTKCGWNYPNPHPSAKNRRAHKKVCGTIKGFEIVDSEKDKQNLEDLQEEHCLNDELKTPSPRTVEKADERIGDIHEEDVFADAACEFSRSDSFKEKEESTKNFGETQQGNTSSVGGVMKSPEVVQESCEVPPVEVLETHNVSSSVEVASGNQQGGGPSTEGHSTAAKTLTESSQEAPVIDGGDTISNVGLATECKGNSQDDSEAKLASALGKTQDTSDSTWNDEVIYSDVEGPHGFSFEATSMVHPGEADCEGSGNVPVDTSLVTANAAHVISTNQSVPDDAENALLGVKSHEEHESNHSVNPCLPVSETPKGEECETNTLTTGSEVTSSAKLLLEEKTEPQGQSSLVAESSKNDPEGVDKEGESSFGASKETAESETLRVSLPAGSPMVADSDADVSHAPNKTGVVDLTGQENSPNSQLSSESSCIVEHYFSPVSVVLDGEDASNQRKSSVETSKDSILQTGAEACESNDEVYRESSKVGLMEESSFINVASTMETPISHSGSTGTGPDDATVKTADQKLPESGRTDFHRVVGGLGVIQANEIDGNVKAHNFYAEVPVTIESNDHRDFGRLQNLSEEHIRSLVSSPLVTRNNTSNAFESNLGSISGPSGEADKPDYTSQSSSLAVSLSKNQEITLEKTTSWSTAKEQHVPLKNLLSEARSPRLAAEAKKDDESNVPRVSSILGQETSPEDGRLPERREVSEEWNSPAKYPVDLKRQERKGKGKPFWVPFVCCSSVK